MEAILTLLYVLHLCRLKIPTCGGGRMLYVLSGICKLNCKGGSIDRWVSLTLRGGLQDINLGGCI